VQKENTLREKLWENTSYLRRELKRIGFDLLSTQTPIIPVLLGETKLALEFSQALWESGIFMPAIRPPTVPAGQARLRLSVSALHQKKDLHYTLEQMEKIKKKIG
jgi:7-keto-8-aminopelargonate synthetase-like enzyme